MGVKIAGIWFYLQKCDIHLHEQQNEKKTRTNKYSYFSTNFHSTVGQHYMFFSYISPNIDHLEIFNVCILDTSILSHLTDVIKESKTTVLNVNIKNSKTMRKQKFQSLNTHI